MFHQFKSTLTAQIMITNQDLMWVGRRRVARLKNHQSNFWLFGILLIVFTIFTSIVPSQKNAEEQNTIAAFTQQAPIGLSKTEKTPLRLVFQISQSCFKQQHYQQSR